MKSGVKEGSENQTMADVDEKDRPRGFDDYSVSLGDELRGERATLGKSLLDVQRDLRIKAAYIAAIEKCDPDVFPNKGFVAGYVRSYARYLGIDPDETFQHFCKQSGFRGAVSDLSGQRKTSEKTLGQKPEMGDLGTMPIGAMAARESIFNHVSPSGIASVTVLVALLGFVTYGGWTVLMDIQRVEFAPIDQAPEIASTIDVIATETTGEDMALSDLNNQPSRDLLAELYRPQELAVPKVDPRDGPIAAINPDDVGQLAPVPEEILPTELVATAAIDFEEEYQGPFVTVQPEVEEVKIFATRAAWVRVSEPDGSILFEAILEPNQAFVLPPEAQSPLLRAGNSGSVYVAVNDDVFGPVGSGTSVAKNVSLLHEDVAAVFDPAQELDIPVLAPVATANNSQ